MIELANSKNKRDTRITAGTLDEDGQPLSTLHGVKVNSTHEGMQQVTEVVVIENGDKVTGFRRSHSGEIDLLGVNDGSKLSRQIRAGLMDRALSTAASVANEVDVDNGKLDMSKRSARIMHILLNEEQIVEGLLPLELHSTGPGNKNETEAYARQLSIAPRLARAMLVMMPVSERMIKPHNSK